MINLNDPAWNSLDHRGWRNGVPEFSGSPNVPEVLSYLLSNPLDIEAFLDLSGFLCTEGDTYPAAYAAVPYILKIAEGLKPKDRTMHLIFLGGTLIDHRENDSVKHLMQEYFESIRRAIPLTIESIEVCEDQTLARHLLASLAAFKGFVTLAKAIDAIDESDWPYSKRL